MADDVIVRAMPLRKVEFTRPPGPSSPGVIRPGYTIVVLARTPCVVTAAKLIEGEANDRLTLQGPGLIQRTGDVARAELVTFNIDASEVEWPDRGAVVL